ncbi:nitrate/nitrite transporter [Caulobacter sp. KR2-114]|uniref:nitrate/nitrite transporter n=1 Tax=Caulobacter sp. KR2-114 TaxID=3400912 RepID=UPI003BFE9DCB
MRAKGFLKSGHIPTLFSSFLYFDLSFMVWVILGPLGVAIAKSLHLDAAQKGFMVATPLLAGAVLRVVFGVLVDHIGPKRAGIIGQLIVLAGLGLAWLLGIHSYSQVLCLAVVLGVAGASFAVALPLASRWYPPEHQGLALGIAGAGNSGTALAALFAPTLAKTYGWTNVIGLAALPLALAFVVYLVFAKDSPTRPPAKKAAEYLDVLRQADCWWLMALYGVTFGGFSGLASSLTIYFNGEYHLDPVIAGFFTAACVFAGSAVRPVGGALADRLGGVNTLTVVYGIAALALFGASFHLAGPALALGVLMLAMMALGAGNGAVFQLAPQRFGREIGVVTGLVGAMGGIGGFYLASTLGLARQLTGSFQPGFLGFAALAIGAQFALLALKSRWRAVWPTLRGAGDAVPVRV